MVVLCLLEWRFKYSASVCKPRSVFIGRYISRSLVSGSSLVSLLAQMDGYFETS